MKNWIKRKWNQFRNRKHIVVEKGSITLDACIRDRINMVITSNFNGVEEKKRRFAKECARQMAEDINDSFRLHWPNESLDISILEEEETMTINLKCPPKSNE